MSSRSRVALTALLVSSLISIILPLSSATGPSLFGASRVSAARNERTIRLYEIHTGRRITSTFKRDGEYVPEELEKLSYFLRDWRRDEPTKMDPQLFDMVWELQQELGSTAEVHVVSGYRSPKTNEKLRRSGGGQAKRSQHMLGKAMDIHFPDVSMRIVRNAALVQEWGGVGYYPTSAIPFVHIDTARVRAWPRLPRTELAMLFPNGPTKHRPADGGALNDADRKRARIALAQLDRQKQVEFLVARAERNSPATQLIAAAAPQKAAPRAASSVVAMAGSTAKTSPAPGLSELNPDSRNLWFYRVAGAADLIDDAMTRPAAAGRPAEAATRTASADLPTMRPLEDNGKPQARPEAGSLRVASLETGAPALQNAHKANLWVNNSEQRREFLAAAFAPMAPVFSKPTGMSAKKTASPKSIPKAATKEKAPARPVAVAAAANDRLAVLVRKTSLDERSPAVPNGWSYRQEQNVGRAPEYDDDHPDELAYRPFQILPLLTAEAITSKTKVVALMQRDYGRVIDVLAGSENIGMQFRPSPAAAEMRWMDQFHGEAIVPLSRRAEALPAQPPLQKVASR